MVFNVLQRAQVDAPLGQHGVYLVQHAGAVQVIEYHTAQQILHRQVECLLTLTAVLLTALPVGGNLLHQGLTQHLMQLPGRQLLQWAAVVGTGSFFCVKNQLVRVHQVFPLPYW